MVQLMFNQKRNMFAIWSSGFHDNIKLMFSYLSRPSKKPSLETKLQSTCSNTIELITLCLSSLQTAREEVILRVGAETDKACGCLVTDWNHSSVTVMYGQSLSGSLWSSHTWFMRRYEAILKQSTVRTAEPSDSLWLWTHSHTSLIYLSIL